LDPWNEQTNACVHVQMRFLQPTGSLQLSQKPATRQYPGRVHTTPLI